MKVIEGLIPISYQNDIESLINSDTFPWYHQLKIANDYPDDAAVYDDKYVHLTPGLTHIVLFENNVQQLYNFFRPMIYFLEQKENIQVEKFLRIRIRRTLQAVGHTEEMYNLPHCDLIGVEPFKTLVYYVEDSDGDTIFFDKYNIGANTSKQKLNVIGRNTPKKGNAVFFDGNQYHAGNNPIKYEKRTIINFDFIIKDNDKYSWEDK